jgi:hypothetical protein
VQRGVTVVVTDFSGGFNAKLDYELLHIVEVPVSAGE